MYTSVGFNAGDYIYQYGANLVGWPKGSTIGMGPDNTSSAGATYTGYKQTSNSRSVSLGPISDQTIYTGSTVTIGSAIVSPTVLSGASYTPGFAKSTTLTDGRLAFAYSTASGAITTAIYSAAGVLQGTTTLVTSVASLTGRTFNMCGLSDGGFVVCYYNSSSNSMVYTRLNSSNTVTNNTTVVAGVNASSFFAAATPTHFAFSYHTSDGVASATIRIYNMSNSFTGSNTVSTSACFDTACAGTSSNTFFYAAGDQGSNTVYYSHVNTSGTLLGSVVGSGSHTNGYSFSACGATPIPGNANNAYAANFLVNNGSGTATTVRVSAPSATTPSISSVGSITASTQMSIGSLNNGGCISAIRSSSDGNIRYYIYDGALAVLGSGTLVTAATSCSIGVAGMPGGSFVLAYAAPTTGFSTFLISASAAYTSGVTVITSGNTYTPATGYSLLGVAVTTASAGSTGAVITNGVASLGSSYPTATSNISFDYTGTSFTARSAVTAQVGNVIGTTVTLKGLE
jgi:hypothetical protein